MKAYENDGKPMASTAKTPASVSSFQSPPRNNAPGTCANTLLPSPPKQLKSPPARPTAVVQSVQLPVALSAQSATHSLTFPTMSNPPQFETHPALAPVFAGPKALTTQGAPSGVPEAASCHSRLVARCFPESAHAWAAWNQVMQVLGRTPAMETA